MKIELITNHFIYIEVIIEHLDSNYQFMYYTVDNFYFNKNSRLEFGVDYIFEEFLLTEKYSVLKMYENLFISYYKYNTYATDYINYLPLEKKEYLLSLIS
jgi:hypothetical protein